MALQVLVQIVLNKNTLVINEVKIQNNTRDSANRTLSPPRSQQHSRELKLVLVAAA